MAKGLVHGRGRRGRALSICGAVALVVALVVTTAWLLRAKERGSVRRSAPVAAGTSRVVGRSPPRFASGPATATGIAPLPSAASPSAHLRALAVYPPTSRPLDRSLTPDLIEWNRRHDPPRVAEDDPAVQILFTADAYWVTGAQPLGYSLRVYRGDRPLAVRVRDARATAEVRRGPALPAGAITTRPITFETRGSPGEIGDVSVYVGTFFPATLTGLDRAVRLRLDVELTYEGGARPQHVSLLAVYTPDASVPARFTGRFHDEIEGGSLVVYAGVIVDRAGFFDIDGNLWDAAGEPIAWTRFKGELAVGPVEIPLRFYGKVLRDAGRPGPWRLGELRGVRYDPSRFPAEETMPPFPDAFVTRAHPLAALSDAPWSGPDHDRAAAALDRDETRGLAPPVAQPSAAAPDEVR